MSDKEIYNDGHTIVTVIDTWFPPGLEIDQEDGQVLLTNLQVWDIQKILQVWIERQNEK